MDVMISGRSCLSHSNIIDENVITCGVVKITSIYLHHIFQAKVKIWQTIFK